MRSTTLLISLSAFVLAACSQGQSGATAAESAEATAVSEEAAAPAAAAAIDLSKAVSGTYVTDDGHRYITFSHDHQGYSKPFLRWRDWTGTLTWDAADPTASSIDVVIDVASIDSGVDRFDEHLKSADFFEVESHPEITFVSTAVEKTGADTGKVTGDLTIKGVTKPVVLDVTLNKADVTREGAPKLGFSARTMVKRSDFGVDQYVPFVGDDVSIIIEAELVGAAAQ